MTNLKIVEIELPGATLDQCEYMEIGKHTFLKRLNTVKKIMSERNLDFLVIYGDREHFANLHYMTGYDPRFEESILVIDIEKERPFLLVGNEGMGYKDIAGLPVEIVLYQTFSLMGQPRFESRSLEGLLKQFGLSSEDSVGLVGTKYFGPDEVSSPKHKSDVPAFITDALREIAGYESVRNHSDIFMHPQKGLRTHLDAEEIIAFEYSAQIVYAGVRNLLLGLREGISEFEAAGLFGYAGFPPLSCHITMGFGENALLGLSSPSPIRRLKIGNYVNFGFGVWGANIARAGVAVSGSEQLSGQMNGILEELYFPYFSMIKNWYESVSIGKTGGSVFDTVSNFVENPKNGVHLNPGHLIHRDEWLHSPFYKGSRDVLHSGMAIQCDIISCPGAPLYGVHVEDGFVLADSGLREEIQEKSPETAKRFERRREFMRNTLGIEVSDEILPMNDIQACLNPYMLRPERVVSCL